MMKEKGFGMNMIKIYYIHETIKRISKIYS